MHAALVSPLLGSAREVAVQQRLDAFRDRFAGPYTVAGQNVTALPMFRMNHELSGNAASAAARAPELAQIGAKAGLSAAVVAASTGRCTPQQLVKLTQALLDAGKLPAADASHPTLGSRIRGMQWEWGIGVDCAGYTQQAAAEAHGKAGAIFMSNVTGDVFSSMMHDKRFHSVMISEMRAGDVIHLDSPVSGQVGHNVVVHSHTTLDGPGRQRLLAGQVTDMGGKAFLSGKGPFHAIEVDSSWGAGKAGAMYGGFRRDTWVYDESSFTWASFPVGDRTMPLQVYPDTGPQDELFGGAFRPKDAA